MLLFRRHILLAYILVAALFGVVVVVDGQQQVVFNEFEPIPTVSSTTQVIELKGTPGAAYTGGCLVLVRCDSPTLYINVAYLIPSGSRFDSNGIIAVCSLLVRSIFAPMYVCFRQ